MGPASEHGLNWSSLSGAVVVVSVWFIEGSVQWRPTDQTHRRAVCISLAGPG